MIDTKEIGAGSYPESLKDYDIKCFTFEIELSSRVKGCIYARDEEEARELIMEGKNDDVFEVIDERVENIVRVVETNPNI